MQLYTSDRDIWVRFWHVVVQKLRKNCSFLTTSQKRLNISPPGGAGGDFFLDSCFSSHCGSNDTTYMPRSFLEKKSTPEGAMFEGAPFSIYQLDPHFFFENSGGHITWPLIIQSTAAYVLSFRRYIVKLGECNNESRSFLNRL